MCAGQVIQCALRPSWSMASTGYHLWSQTYDRDLRDVLKLQTEIANAVASALKVTLLADAEAKIELGGTTHSAAFDAYLRAGKIFKESRNDKDLRAAITGYTDAIRLDRNYAAAYAERSMAFFTLGIDWAKGPDARNYRDKASADARQAIDLAPELAEGHLALSEVLQASLEFIGASRECDRALELAPNNATVLVSCGYFAVLMGHTDSGLSAGRRSVELDPLNAEVHLTLGQALWVARRYDDAIVALTHAKALFPNYEVINGWIGFAYLGKGDLQSASSACVTADQSNKELCLAVVYEKLGRRTEAQSMLDSLRNRMGDDFAALYASVYAYWGDKGRALNSLETAMRLHNAYLIYVKTIPNFDSIRNEPRFQAIEKALNFPD